MDAHGLGKVLPILYFPRLVRVDRVEAVVVLLDEHLVALHREAVLVDVVGELICVAHVDHAIDFRGESLLLAVGEQVSVAVGARDELLEGGLDGILAEKLFGGCGK